MKEAQITISGVALSYGESMTVRCAVAQFAMFLADEGFGDGKHGKAMTEDHLQNIIRINQLIALTAK